ncbi:hypothetical protein [Streptomyces sp. NPDC005805]|uniref:hypothetical protein n=1 Tax=Streptomyces sp. NPDC005805 TaxID=3157068 RepID=UPI0033C95F0E
MLKALERAVGPADPIETARALVVGRSVRIALCVDGPCEIEAIGHALDVCRRLLTTTPEFAHYRIADCKLL